MGTSNRSELFLLLTVQQNCVRPPEECIRCRSRRSRSSKDRESDDDEVLDEAGDDNAALAIEDCCFCL
jgi:hypothetical protein